ncbi:DUF6234 family protein [Streptomyces sp. NBC_00094]|uniref:DUF6234 family protein n=1 Tax=Streptomyces sp. NBC_00094 TaxID=2903620 RepID=UPI002253D142|nr:DUF6234 family protein [Streptomyces sp. NBC_00094]MCX5392630.1 DUF6234 family protein [Streptomyces sp. NBC_00094]
MANAVADPEVPYEGAAMPTSPPPVRPWADFLSGLLLLVLETVLAAIAAFTLGMRRWAESYDPQPSAPPPMDWVPVLVFGGITGGVLLLAWVSVRSRWPWTAGGQFLAAALLGIATLTFGTQEWARSHPAPPGPTVSPTPGEARCVCRSGGGPCECPGG